jgi:hypothetical protein
MDIVVAVVEIEDNSWRSMLGVITIVHIFVVK